MRHGKKINHLSRTSTHRNAMLSNMAVSLILHKGINTTVAKAKVLKTYIEPIITRAKNDTTHNRRIVFSYLKDKAAVAELFNEITKKVGDRPGGYTRILRIENRAGDNAELCRMELVDYNENMLKTKKVTAKAPRTRRAGTRKKVEPKTNTEVSNQTPSTENNDAVTDTSQE